MRRTSRLASPVVAGWRRAIVGTCAAAALAFAAHASALTNIGPGAFSPAATKITFEDTPGDNSDLPAGYGAGSGIAFNAGTESEVYADYGGTLATAASGAGLGAIAATWGCSGDCGTGFTLSSPRVRVGGFISSNVDISVTVTAFRGGVSLGSQLVTLAANEIGFFGFEDAGGIDRIDIGNNTACPDCIHQLDNVMFEDAVTPTASAIAVPTMSQWGLLLLSALVILATTFALRRRPD